MIQSCKVRKRKLSEIESSDQAQTRGSKSIKIDQIPTSNRPQGYCKDSTSNALTECNLRELDKINIENKNKNKKRAKAESRTSRTEEIRSLYQVARQGGLDLTDLIGFIDDYSDISCGSPSDTTLADFRTTLSLSKTRQALVNSGIFHYGYYNPLTRSRTPKPKNLDEIRARAVRARPESDYHWGFEQFDFANIDAIDETQKFNILVHLLDGDKIDLSLNRYKILFTNINPLIKEIPTAMPDSFWGAPRDKLKKTVLDEISGLVEPSFGSTSIAPNFFLQVSGQNGGASMVNYPAVYDGALGERGQIALRSWQMDGPKLDNKSHTFTLTYIYGLLTIYSVHAEPSKYLTGGTDYHLYKVDGYCLTGNADKLKEGVTAYRNLRDYAEEIRNESIEIANRRAEEIEEAEDLEDLEKALEVVKMVEEAEEAEKAEDLEKAKGGV